MTENEVIKITVNNVTEKEINLQTLYQLVEKFNKGHWGDIQLFEDEENRYSTVIEKVIEEIQQYRAIGTVEEIKALKEKSVPKKPIRIDECTCPSCGTHNEIIKKRRNTVAFDTVYCWHCGQAIEVKRD